MHYGSFATESYDKNLPVKRKDMKLTRLFRAFAISAVASLGLASQAEAAVTMYFSSGTTCSGASATAAYSPAAMGVDTTLLLCAATTAGEPLCAHSTFLQSAVGESGRFAIQNRVPGTAFPSEVLSEVYPYLINNPNTAPDFGSFNSGQRDSHHLCNKYDRFDLGSRY